MVSVAAIAAVLMGTASCTPEKGDGATPTDDAQSVGVSEEPKPQLKVWNSTCNGTKRGAIVTVETRNQSAGATLNVTVYRPYRKEGGTTYLTSTAAVKDGTASWKFPCYKKPQGNYEVVFTNIDKKAGVEFFSVSYPSS